MDRHPTQSSLPNLQPTSQHEGACVEGTVDRIVYENADSGFMVARLHTERGGEEVTFVGALLALTPGDSVRLWGRWEKNPKFGPQLRVERYETLAPSTVEGIERYLGSGLVQGIGKTFAKRIVNAFGSDTLRVIDEAPQRLREVEGIGRKRAVQIRKAWEAQKAIQSIMMFLQGHGIAMGQAVRIYKQYGDKAVTVLRENPYRLATDVRGIAFKTADAIAREMGVPKDSPLRAEAGLGYVLERSAGEGHVYLPWGELRDKTASLLEVDVSKLDPVLDVAVQNKTVIREGESIYSPLLHRAEVAAADLLRTLLRAPLQQVSIDVEKAIHWVERTKKISLSNEQRDAIRLAVDAKVMVITGGPGTGKTTLLNGLLDIFSYKGLGLLLAAPTGRAAKRMTAATGREAQTIHRLLEFSPKKGGFKHDENDPLDADLLVVDECSMVDIALLHQLLRAVPPGARLLLVGDVDQLPSVGPGSVLLDVISSREIPVAWLKTVFRQAAESGIVSNAHRINQGQPPEYNDTDFFFVERSDAASARDTVVEVVANRIPRKFGLHSKGDVQVLSPMRRGDAGVNGLNEALKQALNPDAKLIAGRPFGVGDKVMQQRNNYDLEVYNGDVGIVRLVDDDMKEVEVAFDDRSVLYPFDTLDELELAYAGTVHKSQGSEYPAVVIPLLPQHYMLLQRNVLYTAITRASRLVVIVGESRAVEMAVKNTDVARRYTKLAERLRSGL